MPLDMVVCVIPAYEPGPGLIHTVRGLLSAGLPHLVVVDDGSTRPCASAAFQTLSNLPGVRLLRHAVNLGKGAALKTALNFAFCEFPQAVTFVTADADGQHAPTDVARLAEQALAEPAALWLGARTFSEHVPWRSRFGNLLTRRLVRWLLGARLSDTQTGLRAIPRRLVPTLLAIPATGYEFELDMLIAARHLGIPLREIPIQTIYLDQNRSSHFNPLLDSMRIYFVLLRFSAVAVVTAILDNLVFILAFRLSSNILLSQIIGRLGAIAFNYQSAKNAVFLSKAPHRRTLARYLALVAANAAVSYGLISYLHSFHSVPVLWAKIASESLLFFVNFTLQRDYIFTSRAASPMISSSVDPS